MGPTPVFVRFRPSASPESIEVAIERGTSESSWVPTSNLDAKSQVRLKSRNPRLNDKLLAEFVHSIERCGDPANPPPFLRQDGQVVLGKHLYSAVSPGNASDPLDDGTEVTICAAADPHLSRLPWPLLHDGASYLIMSRGASVALADVDAPRRWEDIVIGDGEERRLLLAVPEVATRSHTGAAGHLEQLRNLLGAVDPDALAPHRWKLVQTWPDYQQALGQFRPHFVYYYGHMDRGALVFSADRGGNEERRVPAQDFARLIEKSPGLGRDRLCLVYVNGCQGQAGDVLSAWVQLHQCVPAVVVNRGKADLSVAQLHALGFWERVLLDGCAPHLAVAEMYRRKIGAVELLADDLRWFAPVCYRGYRAWKAPNLRSRERLLASIRDPYWDLKVDRVIQYGTLLSDVLNMLVGRYPRTLALVWYGTAGQGVRAFHRRLEVQLPDQLGRDLRTEVLVVKPKWPDSIELAVSKGGAFEAMCKAAFRVEKELAEIPDVVRKVTGGRSGVKTLVVVSHETVPSGGTVDLGVFRTYLEWWHEHIGPLFGAEAAVSLLLCVSFEVRDPARFREIALNQETLPNLGLRGMTVTLLEPFEKVSSTDLFKFLDAHQLIHDADRRKKFVDAILLETHGGYEAVIEKLREEIPRLWNDPDAGSGHRESAPNANDY